MSVVEFIKYQPMQRVNGIWQPHPTHQVIENFPQIFFKDGEPFREVNKWAFDKYYGVRGNDLKTITRSMKFLNNYVSWLEDNSLHWKHFPRKMKERCLVRYRGYLMELIRSGIAQCTTVRANMASVIQFYRYVQSEHLIESENPLWKDDSKVIQFYNSVGFKRTLSVTSSELSIPCRKQNSQSVEGGLLPITKENRHVLLKYLKSNDKQELYLMHALGFFVGLRSESVRTLTIEVLENAIDDQLIPQFKKFYIGAGTAVKTKYNVPGWISIHDSVWKELIDYYYSERALYRRVKACPENKSLVFITSRGNPYSESTFTKLLSNLRSELVQNGLSQFGDFKFHQSRATFGTMMMSILLNHLDPKNAIVIVRDAMLHKNESTTWGYIKFIESLNAKSLYADEFFNFFVMQDKADTVKYTEKLINHDNDSVT